MKSNSIHWCGSAGILGGILWSGFFILQAAAPAALHSEPYTLTNPAANLAYNLMFLVAVALFVVVLLGLYAGQAESAGAAGKVGAVLALVGDLLFTIGGVLSSFFNIDGMWYLMMAGAAVLPISLLVLGATAVRTQVLGRWSIVPLVVGLLSIAAFLGGFLGIYGATPPGMWIGIALTTLMGVGWMFLDYALTVGRPIKRAGMEHRVA